VQSIRAQTLDDWRLIVVDDGSTDDGPARVQAFDDPRIDIIHQANQGPGAARNAGLERATAPYVAFLDADDEWLRDYLKTALAAIQAQDVGFVASMFIEHPIPYNMPRRWARRGVYPGHYELKGREDPAWADWLLSFPHVGSSVVCTDAARRYGGFYAQDRCTCGEDTVFFIRLGLNERFRILEQAGTIHHREASHLSATIAHPLAPFLLDPQIILAYCSEAKEDLARGLIEHMALRHVWYRARHGRKAEARELLERVPGARRFRWRYLGCRLAIATSSLLPYWVRFKVHLGRLRWALHRRSRGRSSR